MDETALVGLLESIYELERDDRSWLTQGLTAMMALCGPQHTYLGYFYDASDVEAFNVWNVCSVHMPPEVDQAFRTSHLVVGPDLLRMTLRRLHVGSTRRMAMPYVAPLLAERERVGWGDIFAVNGLDPSGIGCLFTIGTREREFSPTPGQFQIYARIAHHIATAFRCRRLLGISTTPGTAPTERVPAPPEAIIDSDGRVVHAEGEATGRAARERIRTAAMSISSARTTGRRAGRNALDVWHPLLDARWTLVDSFEDSGHRYIVARENEARSPSFEALTGRERQVVLQAALGFSNKEIAYALGISDSTVRVLMARAAARLGVRSRTEVVSHPLLEHIRADRKRKAN